MTLGAYLLNGVGLDWDIVPQHLVPLLVFSLRASDLTLSTLRTLAVVRGGRRAAWLLGIFQALLFVTGVAGLLSNLLNPWNLLAYAGGFATGNVIGMMIEQRISPGHSLLRIVSARRGNVLVETLREEEIGATEVRGHGLSGTVSLILCHLPRRQVDRAKRLVTNLDPEAFVSVVNVRQVGGGWQP